MRLRTATGFAVASLAAAVAVMAVDGSRAADNNQIGSLSPGVIVIEDGAPAPHYPAWWECEESTAQDR